MSNGRELDPEAAMKFNFEIGEQEKHAVEFGHGKFSGHLNFMVDGKRVPTNHLPHFSARTEFVVNFLVGEREKHEVRVQIVRPLFLASLRRGWKYNIFVDGKDFKRFKD